STPCTAACCTNWKTRRSSAASPIRRCHDWRRMLDTRGERSMESSDDQFAAMCAAHTRGDVDAIRKLLEARPELEEMDEHSTWLHRAAEAGQAGVIDFWLGRGWNVNRSRHESRAEGEGEATPLHYARDAATTRHLLSRGARVNAWSRYGGTPLHCAVV